MKKTIITILAIAIMAFGYMSENNNNLESKTNQDNIPVAKELENEDLKIHVLDVGQADAILIELPNKETMLIDAGESRHGDIVNAYLKSLNHKRIDYVIGTHPHSDHIGGLAKVIKANDIGNIYLPKVASNTKTYENLLLTIQEKDKKIKRATAGVNILNTNDLKIDIIAPNSETYSDLNNYSAVVLLKYKDTKYLFMGDAEGISEREILTDVNADVIKIGHHGSDSSSTIDFINRVTPRYGIISVGTENKYNLPKSEVIGKYRSIGASIYRTDQSGNIIISSDGENIKITTEK